MKTTVIHHDADYDGLFCREIAKKFLPNAEIIGWDFGRPQIPYPDEGILFVMDLPYFQVLKPATVGWHATRVLTPEECIVLDHHKTSLQDGDPKLLTHCIDGVAACRLAWQYFTADVFPGKQDFIDRKVVEPYAVTLAGEYDIWDHHDRNTIDFQFGLKAEKEIRWPVLLSENRKAASLYIEDILDNGIICRRYSKNGAANLMKRSFELTFEGLTFIALNTARANSLTFVSALKPNHDACLAYYWDGEKYNVSMYGSALWPDVDLSVIAKKYGGGGHKQACGFSSKYLPWSHELPLLSDQNLRQ